MRYGVIVVLVVAFVVVVARFVKHDVAASWDVVATCFARSLPVGRVAFEVDTAACAQPPADIARMRGWPIVTFVLPAEAGLEPDVSGVHADRTARSLFLDYSVPSGLGTPSVDGMVLVFVELSPEDIPKRPFTIVDTAGHTVVSTVPPQP